MLQVLMVDDDAGQLRLREIILRNAGLTVTLATDAESALACLRSKGGEIGLVVTDHNLPGRSGPDLVRELRLTAPTLPVVVFSGMPGIEPQYDGLHVTFCFKPLHPDEFIQVIQRSLSQ
jgi:DNA-binding NtrC family response regulator